MNKTATRPLVRVGETHPGMKVTAITGSSKSRDLEYRPGVIVGYNTRNVGPHHYVVDAKVRLDDGQVVVTGRLTR